MFNQPVIHLGFKFIILIFIFSHTAYSQENDLQDVNKINNRIAVIALQDDPTSIKVAQYYIKKRKIPEKNLHIVDLNPNKNSIQARDFIGVKTILDFAVEENIQFYVLTWTRPYRVECMSITSAFAFDYNQAFCSQRVCSPTARNPYFNSNSNKPFAHFGIRPAMMLAYQNLEQAKALIDRGVKSDGSMPSGSAYLISTTDKNRNVRAANYSQIKSSIQNQFAVEIIKSNTLKDKHDVMFYFTGLMKVENIESNSFLPGAITDHLTSTGGKLFSERQMSIMDWITAGSTASYGTVVEPCNYPQKFPNPQVVINKYLLGESLIEAYWKSVEWPGEGLFIGEPLAKPFNSN